MSHNKTMSVSSLIDRFQDNTIDEVRRADLARATEDSSSNVSEYSANDSRKHSIVSERKYSTDSNITMTNTNPQLATEPVAHDDKSSQNNPLSVLLGPEFTTWPYSEEALVSAISFRAEQEKTRQHEYRLEIANRNLEILHSALNANIPSHLIPMIYGPTSESSEIPVTTPLDLPEAFKFPPSTPRHQRFGSSSSTVVPQQPPSPSRLRSPIKPPVSLEHHQRHISLPPQFTSIPEATPLEFKSPRRQSGQGQHGHISPIQVKPMPSQPPKQPPPSQESMTSLQHVIQFHHWQPSEYSEADPETPQQQQTPTSKRRRSNNNYDMPSVMRRTQLHLRTRSENILFGIHKNTHRTPPNTSASHHHHNEYTGLNNLAEVAAMKENSIPC